jgi:hypothetical protein
VPGAVLLREERSAPVNGDAVNDKPLNQDNETTGLFTRRNGVDVAVARLPQIAGKAETGDELQRDFGPEDRHPIRLELRGKRIQAGAPAIDLLIDANDQIEDVQDRKADPHAAQVDYSCFCSCASGGARCRAHS